MSSGLSRAELRSEVEEVIRNAYREGWRESRRWPNHPEPPGLEILWDQPGGIAIKELPR